MGVDKQAQVPANCCNRIFRFGNLATGMAATAISHCAWQLATG